MRNLEGEPRESSVSASVRCGDDPEQQQQTMVATMPQRGSCHEQLVGLCIIARLHQVAADPATLAHQLSLQSTGALVVSDILRAAKYLSLKAKLSRCTRDRLTLAPLPALAVMHSETGALRTVVLAQCDGQRVLVQDPSASGA
ncbi:cysteine peptidase family C39 domain-containing protein, partial [Acidovorax sp. K2F]|uniref:cysteine peptidase family C39 domain-containing protein n=1 Tax=Acidovorax sp. K2F TaxID=2978125 RepID=UPI0021B0FF40